MLAVLATAGISAQSQTHARIIGVAKDTTGGALSGVTVELRARNSVIAAVTKTDRSGRYQFDAV